MRLCAAPRDPTLWIENHDGRVNLLICDQVIYSAKRYAFTRDVVRPRIVTARVGATTGDPTLAAEAGGFRMGVGRL